jgi:hypothetical protein
VTGFAGTSKDPFFGSQDFCGTSFDQLPTRCEASQSPGDVLSQDSSCTAGDAGNQKSFNLTFDKSGKAATLQCKANGAVTYTENLSSCRDYVLDYQAYVNR